MSSTCAQVVGILALVASRSRQCVASAGQWDEARRIVSELEALPAGQSTPLAVAYVGLGDTARALDHLEAAAASRDPYLLQMSLTPTWFEPIRSHPRFAAWPALSGSIRT